MRFHWCNKTNDRQKARRRASSADSMRDIRITTWNVNGIRNPFGYQPWRDRRTFEGMFEVLEADIVVMQELKIQRKDLSDDMVLVPGWDCYFSLPKHKKGTLVILPMLVFQRNITYFNFILFWITGFLEFY